MRKSTLTKVESLNEVIASRSIGKNVPIILKIIDEKESYEIKL